MTRRVAVPDRVLTMGLLDSVDYQDSYVVDAPAGFRAGRSADAVTALAFGSLPAWLRGFITVAHRGALGLQLEFPSTVPVPGWRRLREEPDEVIYGVEGKLLTLRLIVSTTSTMVRVCTLGRFDRPVARVVWAGVGPVHRVITRVLLHRGVIAACRQDAELGGA